MPQQSLLRYSLPKHGPRLYAGDFREMVAKAANQSSLFPESFFHYRDGKPISEQAPDIRFIGGKSWVGILSRSGNQDALLQAAGLVSLTLGRHFGVPVAMELEQHDYDAKTSDFPIQYYVRDAVRKDANRWNGSNEDLLARIVCDQLRAERDRLGLDLPGLPGARAEEDRAFVIERLGIMACDVRALGMRLTTSNGPSNQFVRLLSGKVILHADLKGIWQVGNLPSRGYGRLIRVLNGSAK